MNALELLKKERLRQITDEGWTPEHDQKLNYQGNLVRSAACYLDWDRQHGTDPMTMPKNWPWERRWWKPTAQNGTDGMKKELIKGAALLMAEYDRLSGNIRSIDDIDAADVILPENRRNNPVLCQKVAKNLLDSYIARSDYEDPDPDMLLSIVKYVAYAIEATKQTI